MKKILLLALMITSLNYAQDKAVEPAKRVLEHKNTISVGLIAAEPFTINLTYERKKNDQSLFFNTNQSRIISIGNGGLSVTNGFKTVDGYGLVVSLGTRTYYKKESWSGFYSDSKTEYGSIKFSDVDYSGTYSYLSIINLDFGYKWQVSKGFSIDPAIGLLWKLEINGTGNVDNKLFDNFVQKFGLKMGYSF